MFDIGFSELLLFGIIALIVLGPEKLPQAARTAGQWYSKLRRTVSTLQSEIEAELDLAETRQQMQEELAKIRQTEAEMKREMAEMRGSMREFETSQNESLKEGLDSSAHHRTTQYEHSHDLSYESKPDVAADLDSASSSAKNFDYSYQNRQDIAEDEYNEDDFEAFSEGYICTDEDDIFYPSADPSKEALTPDNLAPVLTKPWQNMWFRLGSYDKARRLPAPPFLPNYKADALLYNHAAQTGFSQVDLEAKMHPIEENDIEDLDSYEELDSESSDNLIVDNTSLATFSTPINLAQNKSSLLSSSMNKDQEDQ